MSGAGATTTTGPAGLRRDAPTLAWYAGFITWSWFLYGFSPAVPLIAAELDISRTLAGLHGTSLAVGTVLAGAVVPSVVRRHGRGRAAVIGLAVTSVGMVGLALAGALPGTLAACLVTAVGGNLLISSAVPSLMHHHGHAGPAAVTEANAVGAAVGLLAPLVVGGSVAIGWGWRPAVGLVVPLAVLTAALLLRIPASGSTVPLPPPHPSTLQDGGHPPLGPVFWAFFAAMIAGVSIEFATTMWAADLLGSRTGAPAAVSTAAVSALVLGMAVARFVLGALALRFAPERLLLGAFGLAGVGFALFWLATTPVLAMVGLVLAGLGYGAHYPMSVSLALRAAGHQADRAQGIATMGVGAAIAAAPLLLGALADRLGMHTAFALVPVLLVLGAAAVWSAARATLAARAAAPVA